MDTSVIIEKSDPRKKPSNFKMVDDLDVDIESITADIEIGNPSANPAPNESGATSASQIEKKSEEDALPTYNLYFDEDAWDELHDDPYADVEVPAQLVYDDELFEIGVEIQGSSTRKYAKKSYKLKFSKKHPLEGNPFNDDGTSNQFDKIILKAMYMDQSRIREAIAFDIWRLMGTPAPRVGMARLFINNDYWGLYAVVEPVDKDFLERNDYPPSGNLYKAVRKYGGRADFSPKRDLELAFEKKTSVDSDWDDLFELAESLQETPINHDRFMEDIDPIFSIENYLMRVIWIAFTQNTDARSQNFFLYNSNIEGDPLWHIIPWDSDICISNHWKKDEPNMPPDDFIMLDGRTYFAERLLKIDAFREEYIDLFEDMLENLFTEEEIDAIVSHYTELVEEELELDLERWEQSSTVKKEFREIRVFFDERPRILEDALIEYRETGEFDD